MKKVFISQPMKDRNLCQIQNERDTAFEYIKNQYPREELELISNYLPSYNEGDLMSGSAQCIELLGEADIAYFVSGWKDARGCRIEHYCAVEYGIEIAGD